MIKANELRIGNLIIEEDGCIARVIGFKPYDHSVRCDEAEGCELLVDVYEADGIIAAGCVSDSNKSRPIPITPERLDKNNIVLYEQDSDLFNLCYVKQNGVVLAVFSRPEAQVFVHSLQNIIYSITGRELNIEP